MNQFDDERMLGEASTDIRVYSFKPYKPSEFQKEQQEEQQVC